MEMGYYPGGGGMTGGNLAGIRGQGGRLCGDGVLSGGDDRWELGRIRGQGGRLCGDGVLSGGDDRWELGRDKGPGRETLWRWGIIRGG